MAEPDKGPQPMTTGLRPADGWPHADWVLGHPRPALGLFVGTENADTVLLSV